MKTKTRENERRDSVIIILILLLGFICIIITGGWALRFKPSWKLDTSMGSNLNPNSDFLTNRPVSFFEPIDSAILTQPAWINVFLTPGIILSTRTPQPPTNTVTNIPPKTNTPISTATQVVVATNTLPPVVVVVIPTNTKKSPPPPPPPTNTSVPPPPSVDLQITMTDNATDYAKGISVQYIIVASNPAGPSGVTGATVTDIFSANLTDITWSCAGSGGASCSAGSAGNINDSAVNLPVGGSVTYTVKATVIASPSGPLANLAIVSVPAGITDPNLLNNLALDTDQLVVPNLPGNIGSTPDGLATNILASSSVVLQLGTALTVSNTDVDGYDLVYYPEYPNPPAASTLDMDAVVIWIGDGSNWFIILDWGNTLVSGPETNTDIPAFPLNSTDCSSEPDNCPIDVGLLNTFPVSQGISFQLDGVVPSGIYPYIRIFSPPNPPDTFNDGVTVDAIEVFFP